MGLPLVLTVEVLTEALEPTASEPTMLLKLTAPGARAEP